MIRLQIVAFQSKLEANKYIFIYHIRYQEQTESELQTPKAKLTSLRYWTDLGNLLINIRAPQTWREKDCIPETVLSYQESSN